MWQPVEADMGVGQSRERKNSGQVTQPKPPRQDSSGDTTQGCNWLGGGQGVAGDRHWEKCKEQVGEEQLIVPSVRRWGKRGLGRTQMQLFSHGCAHCWMSLNC